MAGASCAIRYPPPCRVYAVWRVGALGGVVGACGRVRWRGVACAVRRAWRNQRMSLVDCRACVREGTLAGGAFIPEASTALR